MLDKDIFLQSFLPVFVGVILSFLFWFGGEWLIRHRRDQKARAALLQEVGDEIAANIHILDALIRGIQQVLKDERIATWLGFKMKLEVYQYIVASGELRLINDRRKRGLILSAGLVCSNFNGFVTNSEALLVTLINHPNGSMLAKQRLEAVNESAEEKKKYLLELLKELQQETPFKEENMDESTEHSGEVVNLIGSIKETLDDTRQSLKQSNLSSSGLSTMGLVLGLTGIGIASHDAGLLKVCLWLIGFATAYNIGILGYFAVTAVQKKRRAGIGKANQ